MFTRLRGVFTIKALGSLFTDFTRNHSVYQSGQYGFKTNISYRLCVFWIAVIGITNITSYLLVNSTKLCIMMLCGCRTRYIIIIAGNIIGNNETRKKKQERRKQFWAGNQEAERKKQFYSRQFQTCILA